MHGDGRDMGRSMPSHRCPTTLRYPALPQALVAYLESFYERTQPLSQLSRQYEKVRLQAGAGAAWRLRAGRRMVWRAVLLPCRVRCSP